MIKFIPLAKSKINLWIYNDILEKYKLLAQKENLTIENFMAEVLRNYIKNIDLDKN